MIDCHIHALLDGENYKTAIGRHRAGVDKGYVEKTVAMYAKLGYKYLRDGGDRWGVGAYAREVAKRYGIVYRTPLAPLSKKGHYGGFIGLQWENFSEFARLVKLQRAQGVDFCKMMVSGLMDFDRFGVLTEEPLRKSEILELVRIAKEEGLSVMAHCNGAEAITACAEAGVDSIEHGAYPDDEALAAMAECGTVWCPTISTIGNLRGKGRYDETAVCKIFDFQMEKLSAFRGLVALGTDAGAWAVPHGCGTETEYLDSLGIDWKQGSAAIQRRF